MPQGRTLHVTLSEDEMEFVQTLVAEGHFGSETDVMEQVVHQAVSSLKEEAARRARWERDVLLPTLARLEADPGSAIPLAQVVQHIDERRRERRSARK